MDEETKGILRSIGERLDELFLTLKRIEERQIAMHREIKEQAPPMVGSYASREWLIKES
jgi:hypothetical protein